MTEYVFRKRLCRTLPSAMAACLFAYTCPAPAADFTLPQSGTVVAGSATISSPSAGQLNINQTTSRTVINWDSFNVGKDAATQFYQPSSTALAVNRVTGSGMDPARILGTLKANGQLMILDRNGVLFGAHARIDVGGIVASTGDVSNAAVMNDDNKLTLNNFGNGTIENDGVINAADSGLVAFVAPTVKNAGVINAKLGKITLAATGDTATVDLYGDGLVELAPGGATGKVLTENSGTIDAEGGTVMMTTAAARGAVDDVINMNGIVNVSSATESGGNVILSGDGDVHFSGMIDAHGQGANVEISGGNVTLGGAIHAGPDSAVTFDPVSFNVDAAAASTLVTALSGGGTVNVSAEQKITVNANINSSAQSNAATLNFHDAGGAVGLEVDLKKKITVGASQTLTGDATLVNVAHTGRIQNGIDVAANDGATVNVASGSYYESVKIGKALTLKGANAEIDGIAARSAESIVDSDYPISVFAGGVAIDGFQIIGHNDGIFVTGSSTIIKNNRILGGGSGVALLIASNNTVTNNYIYNGNSGIYIYSGANNLVQSNHIEKMAQDGISIQDSEGSRILGNTIDTTYYGIFVINDVVYSSIPAYIIDGNTISHTSSGIYFFMTSGSISNNIISDSLQGINISNVSNSSVTGNTIKNAKYDAITVYGSDHVTIGEETPSDPGLFSNKIDYAGNGITVSGGHDIVVSKNLIDHTVVTGIDTERVDALGIDHNHIMNGSGNGIFALDGDTITIGNNVVENVSGSGILDFGDTDQRIISNRADKIGGNGFVIASSGAFVQANRAWQITSDGFHVQNAGSVKLLDNYAGSDLDGVSKGAANIQGSGFTIDRANGATVLQGNRVTDALFNGIRVTEVDNAVLASNVIINSGAYGLDAAGPNNGSIVLTGNALTANSVGALFESGQIDLRGATNSFTGGNVALQFAPRNLGGGVFAAMSLLGNTFGTTSFSGQTQNTIQLSNGAFYAPGLPTQLNALNVTFDGVKPSNTGGVLTLAQYNAIESRILHWPDDHSLGVVNFGTLADGSVP